MSKVLVIYTGGTIGMVHTVLDNPASPLLPVQNEQALIDGVPALAALQKEVPFDVQPLRVNGKDAQIPAIDSSDINVSHWAAIAQQIEVNYDKYDGFVVLHGTDTMAYTASALSFMLNNLAKPVIVTGSQIPIAEPINDGLWNFGAAVRIAGYRHTGLPLVPEVAICFADHLFRGNRVRKMSTTALQGFDSPNYPVLGDVTPAGIHIYTERLKEPRDPVRFKFRADTALDTGILDFGLFPSLNTNALDAILKLDLVHGMVLRTFGAGNAPADENRLNPEEQPGLIAILAEAVKDQKVIVNVTPCPEGQVEAGLYAASSALLENGVISGLDMTPEAALTKLMWLLQTEKNDREEVRIQMQVDHRGELSESLVEARYAAGSTDSGTVTLAARPQGRFDLENLTRAVLRISGLKVGGGDETEIAVFINNPDAKKFNDPSRAGHLSVKAAQADVTDQLRSVVEEGRSISITLLADDNSSIEFVSMALALFYRS